MDDISCAICQGKPTTTFLAIPCQQRVLCCSVFSLLSMWGIDCCYATTWWFGQH